MIRGAFFAVITVFVFNLSGQNYHPLVSSAKTWSIAHSYGQPFPWFSDYTRFGDDTLINSHMYKKVWKSQDSLLYGWTANGFIREDNQKVYYLSWAGGPPNNLIYDFNVNTGDTVYLFSDPMEIRFIVDSVGSFTLLTGEIRRRIDLSCYSINTVIGHDTWIEGIGSLSGVLGSGSCALVGDDPKLLCCHDNDTLKYMDLFYNICRLIKDIQTNRKNNDINRIFLNEDGQIVVKIRNPLQSPVNIRIIELTGQILCDKLITQQETIIKKELLPLNSWILFVITGTNSVTTGKFFNNQKSKWN